MKKQNFLLFFFAFIFILLIGVSSVAAEESTPTSDTELLFSDNFETGLSKNWGILDGKWRMVNRLLTAVEGSTPRIQIETPLFADGSILFDFGNFRSLSHSQLQIGVRQNNGGTAGYWFSLYQDNFYCYIVDEEGKTTDFFEGGLALFADHVYRAKIDVRGDIFSFMVDDEPYCSFQDDTFSSGKIIIQTAQSDLSNPYPWLDNFEIAK